MMDGVVSSSSRCARVNKPPATHRRSSLERERRRSLERERERPSLGEGEGGTETYEHASLRALRSLEQRARFALARSKIERATAKETKVVEKRVEWQCLTCGSPGEGASGRGTPRGPRRPRPGRRPALHGHPDRTPNARPSAPMEDRCEVGGARRMDQVHGLSTRGKRQER